jgi:hypothetical protein
MRNRFIAFGGILFVLISLACSLGLPGSESTPNPTTVAKAQAIVQTQSALVATQTAVSQALTQAASTPTPASPPTETRTPQPTPTQGPIIIEDDFSRDTGRWRDCDECFVHNGALYMGPAPAVDSAKGYLALCNDCGVVDEYRMGVEATYRTGASDRGFGLVLWEYKNNYISLEITTWQVYGLWYHDAEKADSWESWYYLFEKPYLPTSSLRSGRQTNQVEVIVSKNDENQKILQILINGREVKNMIIENGPGRVGLNVGLHSLGVTFDNFYFEGIPFYLPGQSGNNG